MSVDGKVRNGAAERLAARRQPGWAYATSMIPDALIEALGGCRRLLFITGAGLSADSGLPTYRGVSGLYENAETEDGMPIEEALSGAMLATRPNVAWRHIAAIEAACRGSAPNEGHKTIAWLESRFEHVTVLTQNVDGLHQAAGSTDVIPIHGDVHGLHCTGCGDRRVVSDYAGLEIPPRCTHCGALVRPEVVLFGEMLPPLAVDRLVAALDRGFDVVFSVGTTSVFPYIAGPVLRAARLGIPTVEINPGTSDVSDAVRFRIRAGARDALVALRARLEAS